MKKSDISKQDFENLNNVFSIRNFLKNSSDYIKDNWLKKTNYHILPIEWFRLGDFNRFSDEHIYFRKLFEHEKILNLANFPLYIGKPTYEKSLKKILSQHNVPEPSEESKYVFEGVQDFYNFLRKELELDLFNEIIYTEKFDLFLIISYDKEVIFICYCNQLINHVENIYNKYTGKYSYQTYREHIDDFIKRGLI